MRKENPIIVALDVPTRREAENLVEELIEYVKIYKVGYSLFLSEGFDVVHMIQDKGGKVFLDLKFHDIPTVISKALEVVIREGVYMLTLHSLGGRRMLIEVVKKVNPVPRVKARGFGENIPTQTLHLRSKERNFTGNGANKGVARSLPILLGVTILTSLNEEDLKEMSFSSSVSEEVFQLATICRECGLNGIICAGDEIQKIREKFQENFLIVTPGVRLKKLSSDDQKRIVTVDQALRWGADYLVMGRIITKSKKPKTVVELILEKIQNL